ncbi:MAG: hypothetical protein ACOCW2_01955 [Chitinivibrionales bacterium]
MNRSSRMLNFLSHTALAAHTRELLASSIDYGDHLQSALAKEIIGELKTYSVQLEHLTSTMPGARSISWKRIGITGGRKSWTSSTIT